MVTITYSATSPACATVTTNGGRRQTYTCLTAELQFRGRSSHVCSRCRGCATDNRGPYDR